MQDYEELLKQRDLSVQQLENEKQELEEALTDLGLQLEEFKHEALSERKNLQEQITEKD